jgi:Chaperone for flagella basal body P-ring formation
MLERWRHIGRLGTRVALSAFALAIATCRFGLAQLNPPQVQRQAAAAVVRALHIDSTPEQIEKQLQLLGSPQSLPPGSSLRLVSVRPGFTPGTWLMRLDCSSRHDCLPFHALLRIDVGVQLSPSNSGASPALSKAGGSQSNPGSSVAPLARSGDRVNLVEELAGMRLQVKAVCLQSGALGDRIRVQNLATHRVLLATIAGKNLVRVE